MYVHFHIQSVKFTNTTKKRNPELIFPCYFLQQCLLTTDFHFDVQSTQQGCGSKSGQIRTFFVGSGSGSNSGYVKMYKKDKTKKCSFYTFSAEFFYFFCKKKSDWFEKNLDVWIDWVQVESGSGFKNSDLLDLDPAENGPDPQPCLEQAHTDPDQRSFESKRV